MPPATCPHPQPPTHLPVPPPAHLFPHWPLCVCVGVVVVLLCWYAKGWLDRLCSVSLLFTHTLHAFFTVQCLQPSFSLPPHLLFCPSSFYFFPSSLHTLTLPVTHHATTSPNPCAGVARDVPPTLLCLTTCTTVYSPLFFFHAMCIVVITLCCVCCYSLCLPSSACPIFSLTLPFLYCTEPLHACL